MAKKRKINKNILWDFIDKIEGDKVIWMIFLLLIMTSMLAVFSSTSLLAMQNNTTRIEIIKTQGIIAGLCVFGVFILYKIKSIEFFRFIGMLGFAGSLFLLALLASERDFGIVKAEHINNAWRTLNILGFQVHVFEVVKVCMILYLSWAIDAFNKKELRIANWLGNKKGFKFMNKPWVQKLLYIYFPIFIVIPLVLKGGNSAALIIGATLVATLLVGGSVSIKEILLTGLAGILLFFIAIGIYKISDGKHFERIPTALSRLGRSTDIEVVKQHKPGTIEFQNAVDSIRQPMAAKIAIYEGGFWGKGPGGSTQKYTVSVMFGDYMYSFILEEYGLIGGILIIILYVSLLARGSLVARMCDNDDFAKTAIGGLTILITSQAFFHMLVNIDIGIITGQTLPLISHGNSALIMFCFAFGVILSISRIAKKNIMKEEAMAEPLYTGDEVQDRLNDLDNLESL